MLRWFRRAPILHVAIDEGAGPVVVLLHGIASSSVTFANVVPLIRDRHRVISIDLLGFGESPAPEDATYTVEEHAAAVHRTLRSLKLRGPVVLVGHSMGSIIAVRYAAIHPHRITRLVIVSPPVYLAPTAVGGWRDRATMDGYLRVYDYLRANKVFTMRAAAGLARMSPIKNLLEVSERNWHAFVLSLEHAIEAQTTVSDLASVRVPVELVYGSLDPFLAPAGIRLVESLRNVTAHRVDGGDHVIRPRMARVVATAIG
jgi:pimeloyl-ACP methyl ester carboxylesterase